MYLRRFFHHSGVCCCCCGVFCSKASICTFCIFLARCTFCKYYRNWKILKIKLWTTAFLHLPVSDSVSPSGHQQLPLLYALRWIYCTYVQITNTYVFDVSCLLFSVVNCFRLCTHCLIYCVVCGVEINYN